MSARLRIRRIAVILLVASALGLAANSLSARGIPLRANAFLQQGEEDIPAAEARARHLRGALFLDARPVLFWEMSRIPDSLPLPEDDFEAHFQRIEARLRRTFDIVVYCSGFGCEASHLVARRLRERGIQAAVLEEGLPAWTDGGYPVEEGLPR